MRTTANVRMQMSRGRVAAIGATLAVVVLGLAATLSGGPGPAAAETSGTVVVHGTTFPDPSRATLSMVGCDSMYDVAPQSPQPMVGQGPGDAPLGARSLAFEPAGGDGIGPAFRVGSVASVTTAAVAVHPWVSAATGVAYVAYPDSDDPDDPDGLWIGRSSLSAPGGRWSSIAVADRAFDWTRYDATTMRPADTESADAESADAGPADTVSGPAETTVATIAAFTDEHGDGPGVVAIGFGCNGVPFNIDDLRITDSQGSQTYDLEGLTTTVEMDHDAAASGATTLRGTLRTGSGTPLPGATLLLQQASSPDGPWRAVGAFGVHEGVATATVDPDERTWYRWQFVDRPLASGSTSSVVAVDGDDAPSATPRPSSGATSTARPSATSSATSSASSATPSVTASVTASNNPSQSSTAEPSITSASPSREPSQEPSQSASPQTSPSTGAEATDRPTDRPTDTAGPGGSTPGTDPSSSRDASEH